MRGLRGRLPLVAGIFGLAGIAASVAAAKVFFARGAAPPTGGEWVGVAELFVTAAGLLYAGLELSKTLEQVTKHPLQVKIVATEGEGNEGEPFLLRFPNPKEERGNEWHWVARFKLYLIARGHNPATRFVGVVFPPEWEHPAVREVGTTWVRQEVASAEGSVQGITWRATKDASDSPVIRGRDSQDFVLLPGDEFYAGEFQVRVIAFLEEARAGLRPPPDVVIKVLTDVSEATTQTVRAVMRGPKEGVEWVR